jgi:hypothetical protein
LLAAILDRHLVATTSKEYGAAMTILRTSIDAASADFAENAKQMRALVEDLRAKVAQITLGGDDRARKAQKESF